MKTLTLLMVALFSFCSFADDTYVRGHVRRDGTYVQGYHRTTPDDSINNNYGTSGNINPYTGKSGHEKRRANDGYGEYNYGNGYGATGSRDDSTTDEND